MRLWLAPGLTSKIQDLLPAGDLPLAQYSELAPATSTCTHLQTAERTHPCNSVGSNKSVLGQVLQIKRLHCHQKAPREVLSVHVCVLQCMGMHNTTELSITVESLHKQVTAALPMFDISQHRNQARACKPAMHSKSLSAAAAAEGGKPRPPTASSLNKSPPKSGFTAVQAFKCCQHLPQPCSQEPQGA